jgi:hypothetical protein
MKNTSEHIARKVPVRTAALAGLLALTPFVAGCGSPDAKVARASIGETWTPHPGSTLVFDGNVKYDGTTWPINCYAETLRPEKAAHGDTLLSLAHKAGTLLQQPANINFRDAPADVFAVALAHINHLSDPDLIQEGVTYLLPEQCISGK